MRRSSFSWVQFDHAGLAASQSYLESIHTAGTLDELGFGTIRSFYSDLFFPNTMSLMTWPRYFIFLPALIERAAGMRDPESALEDLQQELCRSLKKEPRQARKIKGGEYTGIIGVRSKNEVVGRYPSDIYWSAMKKQDRKDGLFIMARRLSPGSFLNAIREQNETPRDADKLLDIASSEPLLNRKILRLGRNVVFPDGRKMAPRLSVHLKAEEIAFLKAYYQPRPLNEGNASLMDNLIDAPCILKENFWEFSMPTRLRKKWGAIWRDAAVFSVLARGAYLMYQNLLLQKDRRETRKLEDFRSQTREALNTWFQNPDVNAILRRGSVTQALTRLEKLAPQALEAGQRQDKDFIAEIGAHFFSSRSGDRWLEKSRECIISREGDVKPHQAHLGPGRSYRIDVQGFKAPDAAQIHWTDYRWKVARAFISEFKNEKKRSPRV